MPSFHSAVRFACILALGVGMQSSVLYAQLTVQGRVVDAQQLTPIPGATVIVQQLPDTTRRWGTVTNPRGEFRLVLPSAGRYRVRISSVGYEPLERVLMLREDQNLGTLSLKPEAIQTGAVTVEAAQERAVVKEDTVEYSASAYKVNPDATAEDLVRKLPGVTIQGGQIQAQGETVRRVLVDGREFFGQDPMAVLRNLPAEVVQSIQVFDRESDQARLTGIRDPSSTEKAINIITNPALRTGQFGRLYGGYGSDSRYQAGATLNFFRGDHRLSVVGLSNNVNQQNFALDDILGITNFAGQQPSGGPPVGVLRMMFQGGRLPGPPPGMRGGPRGGPFAQIGNFFVPEQSGINTAHALGLMYSNRWGSKLDVTGSYFFNTLLNTADSRLQRQYFSGDSLGLLYSEQNVSEGTLGTHRLNVRLEFSPDTSTTLLFTPRITYQPSKSTPEVRTVIMTGGADTTSQSFLTSETRGDAVQSFGQLLFVRRFAPGRSLSLELEGEYDPRQSRNRQSSRISGGAPAPWDSSFAQRLQRTQTTGSLTLTATYSEPLDSVQFLQLRYVPSWGWDNLEQEAWATDSVGNDRFPLQGLASLLRQRSLEQRVGVAYLYQGRRFQGNLRLDYSWQSLRAEEQRATPWSLERRFSFWLPFAMVEYRPVRQTNLRVVYRTYVQLPSAGQLQAVVDNSNPTALVRGNPELRPSYSHMLFARLNATDPWSGRLFFAMLRLIYGLDYISTATTIAQRDTLIEGIPLPRGGQVSSPVNLDGYWSGRTFWVIGMPAPWLRSTLNLNLGMDYSRTPALVNGARVRTDWYAPSLGLTLSSNWSEQVDFTLGYTLGYNRVRTTAPTGNSDYVQHRLNADVTLMPGSWVFLTQLQLSKYNGLGGELDKPIAIWNLGIGYRFLERKAAQVRLLVVDLLNQNKGISRTVTGQYVEDATTRVLGRYAMLQFSYQLRNFAL